jgi:hypothetical protein
MFGEDTNYEVIREIDFLETQYEHHVVRGFHSLGFGLFSTPYHQKYQYGVHTNL